MTKSDYLLAKLVWEADTKTPVNSFTEELKNTVIKAEGYLVDKYDLDSAYEIREIAVENQEHYENMFNL